jgi:hypothetical protein
VVFPMTGTFLGNKKAAIEIAAFCKTKMLLN